MSAAEPRSAPSLPSTPSSTKQRRGANLLRDYYGLSSNSGSASASSAPTVPPDPTNPDNPAFQKDAALSSLLASSNLSQLLAKESKLITEIRELDGERQSLVYNHHHQLVSASDTIRNMKQKSESLDPTVDALKASFSEMSQLGTELEALHSIHASVESTATTSGNVAEAEQAREMLADLEPVVTLPTTLRDLVDFGTGVRDPPTASNMSQATRRSQGLAQAERLWGQMESVLSAWSDAGVVGTREIMAECRSVLKEARRAAGSSALQ